MSMFDYVKCRYPLPENLPADEVFQTQGLTNALMEYTISEEGQLQENSGNEDWSDFTGTI
ncbi:MAG: hypothetical protein M3Y72_14745 [Acidobacteriota bacterium]|nr:hypothetical protein [Acidobacteriota bacterium]